MFDDDEFLDDDEITSRSFKKKQYNSLHLWRFYKQKCEKLFPAFKLPRKPVVRVLANLKKMLSEYGEKNSKKYIEICVRDWNMFKRKYKISDRYPNIYKIFTYRDSISSVLEDGKISLSSKIDRTNEKISNEDVNDWLN